MWSKKRSAIRPTKKDDMMVLMAMVVYPTPIWGHQNGPFSKYMPVVTYWEPRMKYSSNIIADSWERVAICMAKKGSLCMDE